MDRFLEQALRDAQVKKGVGNRKDPLEFKTFLAEWRKALMNEGGAWDGERAIRELQTKGMYEFLLFEKEPENEWQSSDLFGRILTEMKAYRSEAEHRRIKEYFDDVDAFLKTESARIQRRENSIPIQDLRLLLQSLGKDVERTRKALERLLKRREAWQFGQSKYLWPDSPRKNLVGKKIELDTRLQVEIGKAFGGYLFPNGITVETIARLIVLAYFAAGLAEIVEGMPITKYTTKSLDVRNIRDILRANKITKTPRMT
jgi:hypothetical protein